MLRVVGVAAHAGSCEAKGRAEDESWGSWGSPTSQAQVRSLAFCDAQRSDRVTCSA